MMALYSVTIYILFLIKFIYGSSVEQIALNYGNDPSEMVVTWAVVNGASSGSICEYGSSPDKLDHTVTASGSTYTLSSYTSPTLYIARMTGLESGNKIYYYRVGSEATGFSDVQYFKTHPGIGVSGVTFHLFGDIGQTNNSVTTLQELLINENALATPSGGIVSMGDLSYANGDEPLWDTFGNLKQFVAKNIPMMTTLGNHEWFDDANYAFVAYKARFDNPQVNGKKQLYYSFNSGLVHWTMVAGYCSDMKTTLSQPCLAKGTAQYDWLVNDLSSVDRAVTPWVFVVFHQPYVNSNTAHNMATEGAPMQAAVEDVLYKAGVDAVFSGHVHAYERSCQVYQYKCTAGAPYYITIGDGGNAEGLASTWVNPQPAWSVFRQASYGYGALKAVNETHVSWSWHQNADLAPVVADSFWIVKGNSKVDNFKQVTSEPVFVSGLRGEIASRFNEEVVKAQKKGSVGH
eukprot:gene5589-7717_t